MYDLITIRIGYTSNYLNIVTVLLIKWIIYKKWIQLLGIAYHYRLSLISVTYSKVLGTSYL